MTIGENIKHYRTQLGLSQEELGQKLLVSRQTISLWEKGQTVPTIDNLIRLKDIFGISIDEILDCENIPQKEVELPNESYSFKYTSKEILDLNKFLNSTRLRKLILPIIILFVILILSFFSSPSNTFGDGFIFGLLLSIILLAIFGYRSSKKASMNNIPKICTKNYEYYIYDNYFKVDINRDGQLLKSYTINFQELESVINTPTFYLLNCSSMNFIIRKSDLIEGSTLISNIQNHKIKFVDDKPINKMEILSLSFFSASIISFLISFFFINSLEGTNADNFRYWWVFYSLSIIPISSLIVGIVLRKKDKCFVKNIVIGIFMTILLCVYGSVLLLCSSISDECESAVLQIEEYTGVDIPEYETMSIKAVSNNIFPPPNYKYIFDGNIYFSPDKVTQFEYALSDSLNWLAFIPEYLYDIAEPLGNTSGFSDIMVYNISENTINSLPSETGKSHYIVLLYDNNNNYMRVIEYEIDYVK